MYINFSTYLTFLALGAHSGALSHLKLSDIKEIMNLLKEIEAPEVDDQNESMMYYPAKLFNAADENDEEEDDGREDNASELKRAILKSGKRSPSYLRFGRGQAYLRFGKRSPSSFLRFGKRNPAFLRFGKRSLPDSESNSKI